MSFDGSVIAGYWNAPGGYSAFRWTGSSGTSFLGGLGGSYGSEALSMSADGSVVVGWSDTDASNHAGTNFRWTAGTGMVALEPPLGLDNGDLVYYPAISSDGSAVFASYCNRNAAQPRCSLARWDRDGDPVIVQEQAEYLSIHGVSLDGSVVVGRWKGAGSSSTAFRWSSDGDLRVLYEGWAIPSDVSADGSVIVGITSLDEFAPQAFVWDEAHGMRAVQQVLVDLALDLTGWELWEATGISDDGRTIVGVGKNPDGNLEAWLARVPGLLAIPEPSSGLLFGLGLAGLAGVRAAAQRASRKVEVRGG